MEILETSFDGTADDHSMNTSSYSELLDARLKASGEIVSESLTLLFIEQKSLIQIGECVL